MAKKEPEILMIADLVDDPTAAQWLDYPEIEGFRVLLRMPDVPDNIRLAARALKGEGETQGVEYHVLLLKYAVAGWEGLKVRDLGRLFPGQKVSAKGAAGGQDLGFCPENVEYLLRKSGAFFRWASQQVKEWETRLAEQEAKDTENLSPTPNTTPTPSA
jgi:hypothetical protein